MGAFIGACLLLIADFATVASVRSEQRELETGVLYNNAALASAQARAVLTLFEKYASQTARAAREPEVREFLARGEIAESLSVAERLFDRSRSLVFWASWPFGAACGTGPRRALVDSPSLRSNAAAAPEQPVRPGLIVAVANDNIRGAMADEATSGRQSVGALFADARAAFAHGDGARARSLLETVLSLLEPADAQGRSVVLSTLASVLASDGEQDRAVELWEQVLPLCDAISDVRGRSLTLDNMARARADQGSWQRAQMLWEQALDIDTRLGNVRDRAATLANLADAVARCGSPRRAGQLWSEAFELFVSLDDSAGPAAILQAMSGAAAAAKDWSDPENLRQRALEHCEAKGELRGVALALDGMGHAALQADDARLALQSWEKARAIATKLGDRRWLAVLLGSAGSCKAALGDLPAALDLWRRSLAELEALGDVENCSAAREAMRRAQRELTTPLSSERAVALDVAASPERSGHANRDRTVPHASELEPSSVSEYDIPPASAPLFLVGELFAALHGRGMQLRALLPGDITVGRAGLARISGAARLPMGSLLEPESASIDLMQALQRYSPDDASAVLAGYARLGYELLDHDRPGFTDCLLDHLKVPEPRPRPMTAPIDVPALMRNLRIELRASEHGIIAALLEDPAAENVWKHSAHDAFQFILALLVVGVDCRPLFARDMAWFRFGSRSPLYQLLWPNPEPVADARSDALRCSQLAPGLELAVGLGRVLRLERIPEPFDFNQVLFWVRRTLVADADEQAGRLGDILLDVALLCARLAGKRIAAPGDAESYLQKGIILLEYVSRGQRRDEGRLVALTKGLYGLPQYPKPFEPGTSMPHLGVLNSLLITYRELAAKSLAQLERGGSGVLRSAALRGIALARHTLRSSYDAAASRDPELAAPALALLRLTIKNYANLLLGLEGSASHEFESSRRGGWQPYFQHGSSPSYLAHEMAWIANFFEAAASEGFSLDVARAFMRDGSEFIAEDNTFHAAPAATNASAASN